MKGLLSWVSVLLFLTALVSPGLAANSPTATQSSKKKSTVSAAASQRKSEAKASTKHQAGSKAEHGKNKGQKKTSL